MRNLILAVIYAALGACGTSPAIHEPAQAVSSTLSLERLDNLRIGQSFDYDHAEDYSEDGSCVLVSSDDIPGAIAIMSHGIIRRISIYDEGSSIKLAEGAGMHSTEEDLLALYPTLIESSHLYTDGKYLTEPGDGARRMFETDENGEVTAFHVGLRPELEYVENCL